MIWSPGDVFISGGQFILGFVFAISALAKVRNPSE